MSITLEQPRVISVDFSGRTPTRRATYRSGPVVTPGGPDKPLRLTGRGRVAVVTLALAVISTLAIVFGSSVVATSEASAPGAVATITVQPGQTLWSIAAEARPDVDIRTTVDQIVRLNALEDGATLPIGATLAVPVGD
ncbi:MAG: LysM domain-containing protein [Allosphingosinicella sp.]